jgi:hypothetical protein
MTKHRMTPFFALTKTPNLKVGASESLQTHLAELLALEALAGAAGAGEEAQSSWATSVSKQTRSGALSFAAFRGKIAPHPETGKPEPELTASRNLSLDEFRTLGLFDELGRADEDWADDDTALGINFSRLHRIARMIENRAPDFMRTMQARIEEDMRSTSTYVKLEEAAERRRLRHEKERQEKHERWLAENAERERLAQEHRELERIKLLNRKRALAAALGHTFSDDHELDCSVEIAQNTSTKGYENTYKAPMPEPWAQNSPFTWVRISGVHGRVFFDASDDRVPEPA